jgi:hypothetical protein
MVETRRRKQEGQTTSVLDENPAMNEMKSDKSYRNDSRGDGHLHLEKEEVNGSSNNNNNDTGKVNKEGGISSQEEETATGHDSTFIETPILTTVSLILIALISYFTYPDSLQPVGRPTLNHVWYFGWISALSTGLGVLPLIFSPRLDTWWVGVTNGK